MSQTEEIMNDLDKVKVYKRAKKRMIEERSFYTHAAIYVVMNVVILFFKIELSDYLDSERYSNILVWNIISTPILWGLGLLGHGLWTFRDKNGLGKLFNRSVFSKKWEEQKIKELINENNDF